MDALKTTKKKDYKQRLNTLPPLRFKKFQMKLEESGVRILIAANFLKKNNHTLMVRDGVLHLKIKLSGDPFAYTNGSSSFAHSNKDMDFKIRLPHKRYRHINSVRFQNGSLQINLGERRLTRAALEHSNSPKEYPQLATSI